MRSWKRDKKPRAAVSPSRPPAAEKRRLVLTQARAEGACSVIFPPSGPQAFRSKASPGTWSCHLSLEANSAPAPSWVQAPHLIPFLTQGK